MLALNYLQRTFDTHRVNYQTVITAIIIEINESIEIAEKQEGILFVIAEYRPHTTGNYVIIEFIGSFYVLVIISFERVTSFNYIFFEIL